MDILLNQLVTRIQDGQGKASAHLRKSAFSNSNLQEPLKSFVDKVANCAYKITDVDVSELIKSGISEDEIFELSICASVGASMRQYENALKVLNEFDNQINN
jgi:hypothetical protein